MLIPNNRIGHIFRNAPGHLPDTPDHRQLLIDTAFNSSNYLGTDKWGNDWYAYIQADGTQVWVQVRKGEIINGGLNLTLRPWHPTTGFSSLIP